MATTAARAADLPTGRGFRPVPFRRHGHHYGGRMVSAWSYVVLAALVALACGAGAWRLARDPARTAARRSRLWGRAAPEAPRGRARRGRSRR